MKFTAKKTVSEVVIDLEDGCVLKLTKGNIVKMETCSSVGFYQKCSVDVSFKMDNGIEYSFKTQDQDLIESLHLLLRGV